MPAELVLVGDPAHADERAAVEYLAQRLPDGYTVVANTWVTERSGQPYEVDAVVVAPHAVYVVEIKHWRGKITGNDFDWMIDGEPRRSPLGLNRRTAQILASRSRDLNYAFNKVWFEGLVFLAHPMARPAFATPTARFQVHTRDTIVQTISSPEPIERRLGHKLEPTGKLEAGLRQVLQAERHKPMRKRIREFDLQQLLEATDAFQEWEAQHRLTGDKKLLRVYHVGGTPEQARRSLEHCRWQASILRRLGGHASILDADPPFEDEVSGNLCVPFEHFSPAVTLPTWLERRADGFTQAGGLHQRLRLFLSILDAVDFAHSQGLVHRLLRPEVVLVRDGGATSVGPGDPDSELAPELRITGFDLAKRLDAAGTVASSLYTEERLVHAAPEVLNRTADATMASDQFSLGVILYQLLTLQRPVPTRDLMRLGLPALPSDLVPRLPRDLDELVGRMLELKAKDRFEDLDAVRRRVRRVLGDPGSTELGPRDPDDLPAGAVLGPDYEIQEPLGRGGLSRVYAALHRPSGQVRALKVARADDTAERALRDEWETLRTLDHPKIVRPIDLSRLVPERLTLIMERIPGTTLRKELETRRAQLGLRQERLFAEDLFSVLAYFEREELIHKDLKPDNLLVGESGLTVIDFSLVGADIREVLIGTTPYRDPALSRQGAVWTYDADRYAAALCLFELHSGLHPFDRAPPEVDRRPEIHAELLDCPSLAPFFERALDPDPARRFTSAASMREAYLAALAPARGEDGDVPPDVTGGTTPIEASSPITRLPLAQRALNALRRGGVHSAGELVALSDVQVKRLPHVGDKVFSQIVRVRAQLSDAGLQPAAAPRVERRLLYPQLADDPGDVELLGLDKATTGALRTAGLTTVGAVAGSTREDLLAIKGIGREKVARLVQRLVARDVGEALEAPRSLDDHWRRASADLSEVAKQATERAYALFGGGLEAQAEIGKHFGLTQPQVSVLLQKARETLATDVLGPPTELLGHWLEHVGGLASLARAARRLEERWPSEQLSAEGFVRLLADLVPETVRLLELPDALAKGPCLLGPTARWTRDDIKALLEAAERQAELWPKAPLDSVRRGLLGLLPDYPRDPLTLVTELAARIHATGTGELYATTPTPQQALTWTLARQRLPIAFGRLRELVDAAFPDEGNVLPPDAELVPLLGTMGYTVRDDQLESRFKAPEGKKADDPPAVLLQPDRSPELVLADVLAAARERRGFRLIVTPSERHKEIGPSVRAALPGATWVSFEERLLDALAAGGWDRAVRAEKFAAQRGHLRRSAETLIESLLEEHGRPDSTVILGDTALLKLCEALDLLRRLYDETQDGTRGLWVVLVPGVIHRAQPLFQGQVPVWHMEGITFPLLKPIPQPCGS